MKTTVDEIKIMLANTLTAWEGYIRLAGRHGSIEDFLKRGTEFHIR